MPEPFTVDDYRAATAGLGDPCSAAICLLRPRARRGDRARRPGRHRARVVSTTGMSYDIHLDDRYGQMNLVDIPTELAAHDPCYLPA